MTLLTVDSFPVEQVVRALRSLSLSEKALMMLQAHAMSPNRAMSRLELAKAVGGSSVNVCNSVYGTLATKVANAIDAKLKASWKPDRGPQYDFVLFLNHAPARWAQLLPDDQDPWVFVMRETFARALEYLDIAPYTSLNPRVAKKVKAPATRDIEEETSEDPDDPAPSDAMFDIDSAHAELDRLEDTEREAVILARMGQGVFREQLLALWKGRCCVTGTSVKSAIVASHIRPWRDCNNTERLDRFNGILLVGTLDRLFDAGLITFEDNGDIRISAKVPEQERTLLGLSTKMKLREVTPRHHPYLAYHRKHVFVDA